ncbi:MAG: DUF4860 domain-containing protein [Clostridia bacterium]
MSEKFHRRAITSRGHMISGLFVFFMIGLFAILATTLTLTGIRAYRSTYEASANNTEGQIALSYLINKIHAYDSVGGVTVRNQEGTEVLCLNEMVENQSYETRIFCTDGKLSEYYCASEEAFNAELGEPICNLSYFSIGFAKPWLLKVELAQPGAERVTMHVSLRAKGAEAP